MARPRKEDQVDIRAGAIREAIQLLTEGTPITLAEVARRVGCKPPALYNHFRNKEALLKAAHDAGFTLMFEQKQAAVERHKQSSSFERLRQGGLAYLRFAQENPALYQLMFSPPVESGLSEDPFKGDVAYKSLLILRNGIIACQQDGYIADHDPEILAFTLWSSVHGMATLIQQNRVPAKQYQNSAIAVAGVDMIMKLLSNPEQL